MARKKDETPVEITPEIEAALLRVRECVRRWPDIVADIQGQAAAYTERGTVYTAFAGGARVRGDMLPPAPFRGTLDELVESTQTSILALRHETPGRVNIVWRVYPQFEVRDGHPSIYCRLAFEPAVTLMEEQHRQEVSLRHLAHITHGIRNGVAKMTGVVGVMDLPGDDAFGLHTPYVMFENGVRQDPLALDDAPPIFYRSPAQIVDATLKAIQQLRNEIIGPVIAIWRKDPTANVLPGGVVVTCGITFEPANWVPEEDVVQADVPFHPHSECIGPNYCIAHGKCTRIGDSCDEMVKRANAPDDSADNVISFATKDRQVGDGVILSPEDVLTAALSSKPKMAVCAVFDENGELHLFSSHGSRDGLWLLERAKLFLMLES